MVCTLFYSIYCFPRMHIDSDPKNDRRFRHLGPLYYFVPGSLSSRGRVYFFKFWLGVATFLGLFWLLRVLYGTNT
jgi:hypothetical protein